MNNRTKAKLTDLSGMQKAIEETLKQAWERGRKYGQSEERLLLHILMENIKEKWIKDKNPDKDGNYLCITGTENVAYFLRIVHFTHDLYQIDPYTFHKYRYKKKTERSGWYYFDEEGFFEVDVQAWMELPEWPEEFRGE